MKTQKITKKNICFMLMFIILNHFIVNGVHLFIYLFIYLFEFVHFVYTFNIFQTGLNFATTHLNNRPFTMCYLATLSFSISTLDGKVLTVVCCRIKTSLFTQTRVCPPHNFLWCIWSTVVYQNRINIITEYIKKNVMVCNT